MVAPSWERSSDKHGIPHSDQVWAIAHATYSAALAGAAVDEGTVWLYIGPPHGPTNRELEILVNVYTDGREARIFHAMSLGPKFRAFREEHPDV